jgi:hypothetical protein
MLLLRVDDVEAEVAELEALEGILLHSHSASAVRLWRR